jgi:3-polyprenyl-4-hydroxybenzoate decarboxylase
MVDEKLKVVKGEITHAGSAEIVVQGWIRLEHLLQEDPFGE